MDFKLNNSLDLSKIKTYAKGLINKIDYKYAQETYTPEDTSKTAENESIETEELKQSEGQEITPEEAVDTLINAPANAASEIPANAAMALGGFICGVGNFGENLGDGLITAGTAIATPFTFLYDQFTGSDVTESMWEGSDAIVATEAVNNAFEVFYTNNDIGKAINDSASEAMQYGNAGFNAASSVGYVGGNIALSVLTGGTSGVVTAGLAGVGKGRSEALNSGATTEEALIAGALTGGWEAIQWGAGIALSGSGVAAVAFDFASGFVDNPVRSGIQTLYNDQGWIETIEQNGGLQSMVTNGVIAGGFSTLGELSTIRGANTTKANSNADIDVEVSNPGRVSPSESNSYWVQNGDSVSPSREVLEDFMDTKFTTDEARAQLGPMFEEEFPEMQKMQINSNTAATFENLYTNPNIDVGIHNVGYASKEDINDILENGLIMTEDSMSGGAMPSPNKIPDYTNNVFKTSNLYDGLLMTSNSYKGSHSEIVIALPSGTKVNDPSLYVWDNSIGYWRLKPEYIVGYVPVDDSGKVVGEITDHLD